MPKDLFHTLSDDQRRALKQAKDVIAKMRSLDSGMPSSYIDAFLAVALNPGHGPTVYGPAIGTGQPQASRILLEIGQKARQRPQALELVDRQPKPDNWREQEYFLTPKGRAVMGELLALLGSEGTEYQQQEPDLDAATRALLHAVPVLDRRKARAIAEDVVRAALAPS